MADVNNKLRLVPTITYNIYDPDLPPDLPHNWQDHAACLNLDPDIFFPEKQLGPKQSAKKVAEAKAICATCPVKEECQTFALMTHVRFGIWGGMTVKERDRMVRNVLHWQKCNHCGELTFAQGNTRCCGTKGQRADLVRGNVIRLYDDEDEDDDE